MRLLAFSDLHRDVDAAQRIVDASADAEVVIGAGDFATRGIGAIAVLDVLRACTVPVIIVHGNHDVPADIAEYCAGWERGHYLESQAVTIAGRVFFGLGGEIPSRNAHPWNASSSEATAAKLLVDCPKGGVLITHTPPHGTADVQKDGTHEGSTAICAAIESQIPQLTLCGHIHNAWGMSGQVGQTPVHNLGPGVNWFTV